MPKITDAVAEPAGRAAEAAGCSVWDVEYVKEGGTRVLRVYIDKSPAVSSDDCETVSRLLDKELDALDPIPEAYTLEVSSPGLERKLKKPEHFSASLGLEIEITLYAPERGGRKHRGILDNFSGNTLTISGETFDMKAVSSAKRVFVWDGK